MKYQRSKRLFILIVWIGIIPLFAYLYHLPKPVLPENVRYVKLDGEGEILSAWNGPWKCVLDKETNLIWEVKSYVEDIHDHQCTFSWFNSRVGTENKGSCFTEDMHSDTFEIITLTKQEKRCDIDNWRLPSLEELSTLVTTTAKPGEPMISGDYFPYTENESYWTLDVNATLKGYFSYLKHGAKAIDFKTGKVVVLPYKSAAFVRLVAEKK